MRLILYPLAVISLLMMAGCAESAVLAGNGASMFVACALLWSTVNINRHDQSEDR